MSLNVILQEKLDQLIIRINNDLCTGNKSVELNDMFEIFEKFDDDSIGNFIEKLEKSNAQDENGLINEFNSFDSQKRRTLVSIMEVISKMGKIHQHDENSKQVMWYDKLEAAYKE